MGTSATPMPTTNVSMAEMNNRFGAASTTTRLDLNNATLRSRAAQYAGAPVASLGSQFQFAHVRGKPLNCVTNCNCNCNCTTNCSGQCRSN